MRASFPSRNFQTAALGCATSTPWRVVPVWLTNVTTFSPPSINLLQLERHPLNVSSQSAQVACSPSRP